MTRYPGSRCRCARFQLASGKHALQGAKECDTGWHMIPTQLLYGCSKSYSANSAELKIGTEQYHNGKTMYMYRHTSHAEAELSVCLQTPGYKIGSDIFVSHIMELTGF